jgi:outer membrane protein assembly factor BamB
MTCRCGMIALAVATAAIVVPPVTQAQAPAAQDWPQFGRDTRRSNWSPVQVDPPYCYAWKWYEAPVAGRAQPVVAAGRLFVGDMDGVLHAREASTGAPLWQVRTGGPIRHSPAVDGATVITGSHDGFTYGLSASSGAQAWRTPTGPSATAPLLDAVTGRVYVASTTGRLLALTAATGAVIWQYQADAPLLTTPALGVDGTTVYFGTEAVEAIAVDAATGLERWRRPLPGQSLANRSPVVIGERVVYRAQPLDHFHPLLRDGDDVMDQAGARSTDWSTDWEAVRPRILSYLGSQPTKQTMFVLDAQTGAPLGIPPVLYTYGNNDSPAQPAVRGAEVYVPYRARHGIQTDSAVAVHVTTRYDGELGRLDLSTLDITALRQGTYPAFDYEFRLTSDEPAALTGSGALLLVDNWERLGGIDLQTAALVHVGAVSNDWPECGAQCGPGTSNPFFPLSGTCAAYPFPSPRVTEGLERPGAVVANNMIYWRVIEGGLAGIAHGSGGSCPPPQVWQGQAAAPAATTLTAVSKTARPLADYVTLDLTTPVGNPPVELVERLRAEMRDIVRADGHLMPYYVQRGFSTPQVWPNVTPNPPGPPRISHDGDGNVYWHDPGELLYTMALAYPYLDAVLQADTRAYVAAALARYPVVSDLPWNGLPWLKTGVARERYPVPQRGALNNWPPVGASIQSLYGLWLWSRHTNDWTHAAALWNDAKALFMSRKGTMTYYADIAGAIGYARMAAHLGDAAAAADGTSAAVQAMQAGLAFETFRTRAESEYLDARELPTGWYMPVFYGMTPEVGLYLREHLGQETVRYIHSKQRGNGLRWWYLTQVGAHAEAGETSFVAPIAGWSHFLAQAYVLGASQSTLRDWLDRRWVRGDLYSIQRLVATIQAK